MLEKMKDKVYQLRLEAQQRQEEKERQIKEENDRLLSLSEKELLVEILLELRRIEDKIDDVETRVYVNDD